MENRLECGFRPRLPGQVAVKPEFLAEAGRLGLESGGQFSTAVQVKRQSVCRDGAQYDAGPDLDVVGLPPPPLDLLGEPVGGHVPPRPAGLGQEPFEIGAQPAEEEKRGGGDPGQVIEVDRLDIGRRAA